MPCGTSPGYRACKRGPERVRDRSNDEPIGTRDMLSIPAAITTSYAPAITPCAAKCNACCDDPHCRSIDVPGTVSGNPAASTALRPMLSAWSPTCDDAAHDHVVDERRIEVVALDERAQRVRGQVDRMPAREHAVAPAERRADRVDDHGVSHASSMSS